MTSEKQQRLIIDGDWGGDEMQLAAICLARPDYFNVLAGTAVFGNAPLPQVSQNGLRILEFLKPEHSIPFYNGASAPSGHEQLQGDGAHGEDGIGGITLDPAKRQPEAARAVDAILQILKGHPEHTVSITATGPQTNIAMAIRKDPETMARAKQIVIMGGCTQEMPAKDMPMRQGNITPYAEFNFQQAAGDAKTVMDSGLPIVIFPMNATHQLTFTAKREQILRDSFEPATADKLAGMIAAPRELDAMKFGIDPVMHDVHTSLYLLASQAYQGRQGTVEVETKGEKQGMTTFTPNADGNVQVIDTVKDPDAQFGAILESFEALFEPR